jgi:hypothetical protein
MSAPLFAGCRPVARSERQIVRTLLALAVALIALTLLSPGVAAAASTFQQPTALPAGAGEPIIPAISGAAPPPHFSSTATEALAVAKTTSAMRSLHRTEHPLFIQVSLWSDLYWMVDFSYRGKIVAEVDVGRTGRVTGIWTGPLATTVYARGHYAPVFDSWWVVVPSSLLFLLPFMDPRRLRRLLHLDALILLSFLVSYYLFDHAHVEAAVWLVYPPLLYLLGRMLGVGMRRSRGTENPSPMLGTRTLFVGLLLLLAARVALSLVSRDVGDVGYASVIGAHRILHGQSLYYADIAHGDTYGPIAYLAYVPFELLFPSNGSWGYLPSAHLASIVFDLLTVGGLVVLGRQLKHGREGKRLGLSLAWAWAACPFTLLGLMMHTNDGLVAMLSVVSLVVFSSPAARGAMVALAAAAKFSPAALLPLYASPRNRGLKGAIACVLAFTAVVAVSIGLYLPRGGLTEFYNHTIGYQLTRPDIFSPWALHPGLAPLRTTLEVLALLLAATIAWVPRQRTLTQVCALAAAVTIAVQLPAIHWFYYYVIWFMPFVLIALLGPRTTTVQRSDSPRLTLAEEPESRVEENEAAVAVV